MYFIVPHSDLILHIVSTTVNTIFSTSKCILLYHNNQTIETFNNNQSIEDQIYEKSTLDDLSENIIYNNTLIVLR